MSQEGLGYAELLVDLSSGDKLYKAFEGKLPEGVELIPQNELHSTIMYDVSNPEITPSKSNKVYKCKVVGVEQLGETNTKWAAAVLLLESNEVQERFKELESLGFKHSFPTLMLHVSVSYGDATAEVLPVLKELFESGNLPSTITLCSENWSSCKD